MSIRVKEYGEEELSKVKHELGFFSSRDLIELLIEHLDDETMDSFISQYDGEE